MRKRSWLILGATTLPIAFVAGVWVGGDSHTRSSVTTARGSGAPASSLPTTATSPTASRSPGTTAPASPTGSTSDDSASLPEGWARAKVIEVVDGDTIRVQFSDNSVERVRLIGTNSPEGGECYAAEAAAGLSALVLGETVLLEPDTSDRDQFGRLLRYVWTLDGRHVNEITVQEGWAIAREYPPDTARAGQLDIAQERAMLDGAGFWASDACGDSNPADVRIVHIEYDAPGNDNFNLNGEWVEIANADSAPVDLTGWTLKDESASHRFVFPSGYVLEAGARVRVLTGCGLDTEEVLHWCVSGSAVWNNSGDTGFLLDPAGNIVHSYAYG